MLGWNLFGCSTLDEGVVPADSVVLSAPARSTARLLSDVVPDASLELARIEYASVVRAESR